MAKPSPHFVPDESLNLCFSLLFNLAFKRLSAAYLQHMLIVGVCLVIMTLHHQAFCQSLMQKSQVHFFLLKCPYQLRFFMRFLLVAWPLLDGQGSNGQFIVALSLRIGRKCISPVASHFSKNGDLLLTSASLDEMLRNRRRYLFLPFLVQLLQSCRGPSMHLCAPGHGYLCIQMADNHWMPEVVPNS